MSLLKKKYAFFSLYLLIAVLHFELILSSVAAALFLTTVLLSSTKTDLKRLLRLNVSYLVILYFIITFIGFFYTDNTEVTNDRLVRQLPMLLLPIGIVLLGVETLQRRTIKKVFVYACLAFCLLSLTFLLFNFVINYEIRYQYNFVQNSMYHFHFPYDSLYINIAYTFLLFGNFSKNLKRVIGLIFLIVIFLFGVRTGILTFLMLTLIYVGMNIKSMFRWQSLLVIGFVIGLVGALLTTSPYVKDKYYDTLNKVGLVKKDNVSKIGEGYHKISLRYELWSSAVEAIKKKPVFGYGTGGGEMELAALYESRGLKNRDDFNSHNQYLTTTLQFGIFGLLVLLYIMGTLILFAIRNRNTEHILYMVVIGIAFMTESFLIRQKGIFIFALFMAIFLDVYRKELRNNNV